MTMRKITSLTAFLAFLLTILTSVVLYIEPEGRVAYWSNWSLWGLSKEEWGAIHINLGTLLVLALALHVYYNWKPITNYLKTKAKQMRVFTGDFNVALLLCLVVGLGTYFEIPPMSTFLGWSESFKTAASDKYGEPPYGHAELSSLASFSQKMGLDAQEALANLQKAGLKAESADQTLKDLALENGVSPQEIYLIMAPPAGEDTDLTPSDLPPDPPTGIGKLPLNEFCATYGLDTKSVLSGLAQANIKAEETMTIKEIAAENNTSPMDVYMLIRDAAGLPPS